MEITAVSVVILFLLGWLAVRLVRSIRGDGHGATRPPETDISFSPGMLPGSDYAGLYRIR